MINMNWLESHIGSIEVCIDLANEMLWNMSVFQGKDGAWYVKGGEKVIFSAESRESVDAFLYGMGLSYSTIPEDLWNGLKAELKRRFV